MLKDHKKIGMYHISSRNSAHKGLNIRNDFNSVYLSVAQVGGDTVARCLHSALCQCVQQDFRFTQQ